MHIKTNGNILTMTESIVCPNYWDMKHHMQTFEKVSDNEYKCTYCGEVIEVKEPVIVHDDKGRLRMQVAVETKQ